MKNLSWTGWGKVLGLGAMLVFLLAGKPLAGNLAANVKTKFVEQVSSPVIDPTAYVHPMASVIGAVEIGKEVMVSPFASVRGDEGIPIHVGDHSNIQDGVVIHALETYEEGKELAGRQFEVDGKKYAVYVGERVSLAHQSQVHGPALIGSDTFIGMQALVFKATVGTGCVLEPASAVIGVMVPDGRYVPAGKIVTDQKEADALPKITDDYAYRTTNAAVVEVNRALCRGYSSGQ